MAKETAVPSDLAEALTRMRGVYTEEIDPVDSVAEETRTGITIEAKATGTDGALATIQSPARRPDDALRDGIDLIEDLDQMDTEEAQEPATRVLYRNFLRELPPNWSSRIVECRDEQHGDDDFVDVAGPDMKGVRHSVKIETHSVVFLWNSGQPELFIFDGADLKVHGSEIESRYTSWEVTPSDFLSFIGGTKRYPDRGARSKRIFFRRR